MSVPGQEERNKQLVYAVMTNNTERVRELLAQGVNPNLNIVGDNRSLLHYAIDQNDPALGGNFTDSTAIVKLLLQSGANPNGSVDASGYTPLHRAIAFDLPDDVIKLILDEGANPNTLNNEGQSPLATAVDLGNSMYIVQALRAHGAIVDDAIASEIQALANKKLLAAVKNGDIDQVNKLLAQGADPNARYENKQPVLHHAVVNGRQDIVTALFNAGADITAQNFAKMTPLGLAPNHAMGSRLMGLSNVALLKAVQANDINMVQKLLRNRANINADQNGQTPLMLAIDLGYTTMVQLLIENGADINTPVNGKTPLDFAKEKQQRPIATLLKDYALLEAAKNGNMQKAKTLLQDGADINVQNQNGWTPLALAVQHGHTEMVKELIETHHAQIDLEARFGTPPGDKSLMALTDITAIKTRLHNNAPLEEADLSALTEAKRILGNLKSQANTFQDKYNTQIQEKENRRRPSFLAFDRFRSSVSAKHTTAQSLENELHILLTKDIKTKGGFDNFISEAKALIDKHKTFDEQAHKKMFSKSGKIFKALDLAEKNLPPTTKRPHH